MTGWRSTWTEPDGAVAVPTGTARGRLTPPPSKSLTHRVYCLALLAGGALVVERPLEADDTRLFRRALAEMGFGVEAAAGGGEVRLTPGPRPAAAELLCGNAGTMFRFLVAALAALPGRWHVDGVPRLRERPVGPLVTALRRLGAEIEGETADGYAPLRIRGRVLAAGETGLEAGASSQYLSALLMAALVAAGPVEVAVSGLRSAPYVELTLGMIERFGGRVERVGGEGGLRYRVEPGLASPGRLRVEADLSAACYPAAAAALTGGRVVLEGVETATRQGDRGFFDLLAEMGAEVEWRPGEVEVRGTGRLRAVEADLAAMPDQVPTLAALAPFAEGTTTIRNVPHLRIKESDRLAAMAAELGRLGAEVEELPDGLVVRGSWVGGAPGGPVQVRTYDDHRIAMSLAVLGLRRGGVVVGEPGVVAKSYPEFWEDLAGLLEG